MKKLGLIGKPLKHSFSKKYFAEKFAASKITDWSYELYPLEHIDGLLDLLKNEPQLVGLNITIPYKESALKYIHELDEEAAKIGAINTINFEKDGKLKGYNTDVVGFENSLLQFIRSPKKDMKALILGTGGASKAIRFTLKKHNIQSTYISRQSSRGISYDALDPEMMKAHTLIINCTPLGTYPNIDQAPSIPYQYLTENHFLYDLVYNPAETLFLQRGKAQGAKTKNGRSMLTLQAEASWDIWNKA